MKRVLLTDWHASRIFRVVTGMAALIYGIVKQDNLMGIAGTMLLLMGLSNTGCGGAGGCGVPMKRNTENKDIEYQELN
jgi:membrane-bound ClpP family serine protease